MADKRKALVTGGVSGIGRAIAQALIAEGHKVVVADLDRAAVDGCVLALGPNAAGIVLDITEAAATARLPDAIPDGFGPIDTLINNAGHHRGGGTRFAEGDIENWASIVETNLIGLMRVSRAMLPGMIARNRGDIVNISSINALRILPTMAPYASAKAGVHMLTDTLRAELTETDIRVTEINPGLTRTNIQIDRFGGDKEKAQAYFDRFRAYLVPEDLARGVMFALNQPSHMQVAQMVILPTDRS